MPSKYKFYNPEGLYFVTMTVVDWIDVFSRSVYKDIMVESLTYAQHKKGLIIHAWVIMSNHIHLIVSAKEDYILADAFRDVKKFTSKKIINEIEANPDESRKKWMIGIFKSHGRKNPNNKNYQFWKQDNYATELDTNEKTEQRLDYLHLNPVKAKIVENPEDYLYSSARDYTGEQGLIKVELLD